MDDGKLEIRLNDEIRLKVTRCREALLRLETTQVDELACACADVFGISEKHLPKHVLQDLARAREALFGNALTPDGDAEVAEDQLRKALITLSLTERMHLAQSLIAFCDGFEDW